MDSPLVRVIWAILGGYLILLLGLSVYDWVSAEFPTRPSQPSIENRVQHPIHHEEAVQAVKWFARLPKAEQQSIKQSLQSNLVSLAHWLARPALSNCRILCIGELHEESTRDFLAEAFFAKIEADTLLLEATPGELTRLIQRMEAGRDYFPLLHADIMRTLRSATKRNPDIKIRGIEETDDQQKNPGGPANSRDLHIAENFWNSYQPGKRNIILFGALHCTNEPNWLFQNLYSQASPQLKGQMINVSVWGEHQYGPMEAFVCFLDEIGIQKEDFVIADTRLLHPRIYAIFKLLKRQILDKYRCVIVFRSERSRKSENV